MPAVEAAEAYIIACKLTTVVNMLQELAKQIDDYTATYGPDDQLEWSLVLGEIRAFIEVSCCLYLP
jgi:Protein SCAI